MTSYIERDAKTDEGREITVELAVESWGSPTNMHDGGDSPILYAIRAWDRQTGDDVGLTAEESSRIEEEVVSAPDFGNELDEPEPGLWEE